MHVCNYCKVDFYVDYKLQPNRIHIYLEDVETFRDKARMEMFLLEIDELQHSTNAELFAKQHFLYIKLPNSCEMKVLKGFLEKLNSISNEVSFFFFFFLLIVTYTAYPCNSIFNFKNRCTQNRKKRKKIGN